MSSSALLVLTLLTCLLARTSPASGQIAAPIAPQVIVDKQNFLITPDASKFVSDLVDAAKKSPENWDSTAQGIFTNMVFVSAAELALLRKLGDDGSLPLPITIAKRDLIGGLLLWDTADGSNCDTPSRLAQRRLAVSDVFLFTGDILKLQKRNTPQDLVSFFTNLPRLDQSMNAMHLDITKEAGRRHLLDNVNKTKYFAMREFLVRVKAHLLTATSEQDVTAQTEAAAKSLGLR